MSDPSSRPWEQLRHLRTEADHDELLSFLKDLPPGEAARALSRLDHDDQAGVLLLLSPDEGASLMAEVSDVQAADLMEALPPEHAAAILTQLPSSDQADVLTELEAEDAAAILAEMAPDEAQDARNLAAYDHDVAGGLMVTEFLAFDREQSVRDLIDHLRGGVGDYADYAVQYLYVVDERRRLVGVLRLRDLLWHPDDTALHSLMISDPLSVRDDTSLEELMAFFDRHKFVGVPVVDADGQLVGLVRRADLEEGVAERSESDYRKALGIVGGEELRTMPVLTRSRRRLSWLSVNIGLNILAASVIAVYQDTIAAVIALAAFLPIISDMSGCSGNQAVAVSIRELSLGLARPGDVVRVWLKEVSVGLINGMVLGLLLGVVATVWQGNIYLGIVVGSALCLNTLVSVSIGGIVPLVLRRFDLDPALASGPILTTVTDMCGFLLTLSFAAAMLEHLV